jgi:hypothetical protein
MAEAIAHPHEYEEKVSAKLILGGALAETVVGIGTMVVSIVGLAGFLPPVLVSIATIGLGVSFLFEGGAMASRFEQLLSEITEGRIEMAEVGGGLSAEFIAGIGGVTLGVLSLVGVLPGLLTAIAAIGFGSALILGAGVKARLSHLTIGQEEHKLGREIARQAVMASGGVQVLVGIGAVVLGILALLGIHPMILTLVATLSVSGMVLLAGSAVGARMLSLFSR